MNVSNSYGNKEVNGVVQFTSTVQWIGQKCGVGVEWFSYDETWPPRHYKI